MKRILITGMNSYIGNQFEEWVSEYENKYEVSKISLRNCNWKSENWSNFDAILHVAGIAHNSSKSNMENQYYKINRDLTTEVAQKAKDDGVPHFINLSSIIVFGTKISKITNVTQPNPDNFYGDSKLQAEIGLYNLACSDFIVTNVRPPMVYGKESKGNFPLLAKLASRTPIFPNYPNNRSIIYIKNLTEFLRQVIDYKIEGNLHPQNPEYVKTSDLVESIGKVKNHKIFLTNFFNPLIKRCLGINLIDKLFGDLYYSKELPDGDIEYQLYNLEESILDTYDFKNKKSRGLSKFKDTSN